MVNTGFWDSLREKSRSIETDMDELKRKQTGSYYTDLDLTDVMMKELVGHLLKGRKKLSEYTFLEPCVGAGNFVFSYLKAVNEAGISGEDAVSLLNNIYVADINKNALNGYKGSLTEFASLCWNIHLDDAYFETHMGSGLLVDVTAPQLDYIPLESVFPHEICKNGFDIVATNPPYKNLKAERGHYSSEDEYVTDQRKYSSISKIVSKRFQYSTGGVLNLYKLFVEEIIDRYASEQAYVSLLIPASILSDKTCEKLRTHILTDTKLLSVKVIGEGSGYIDAQQALSAVLLKKGEKTSAVDVIKDYCSDPDDPASINIDDILNEHTGNAIIAVSKQEYEVFRKLRKFPVVKDLDFVVNLRGELDLTENRSQIVSVDTGYPLLRGRNIGYYQLLDSGEHAYVTPAFVEETKKREYIKQKRIICQQIANMHKERRVTFALAPENYVLGNSCNFIAVLKNEYGIDIYTLLGLFNTKIINWYFKLTSSNNHINNYEIDCFPISVGSPYLRDISILAKECLKNRDEGMIERIEKLAEKAYGLDTDKEEKLTDIGDSGVAAKFFADIQYIIPSITFTDAQDILAENKKISAFTHGLDKFSIKVAKGITSKYQALYKGFILNHTTFKLSDLDLEMIQAVPQGGSWKDIPEETVKKSKRLERITQTGGRTTLYGRIDYNKPSYTITTYFNRPGNGTYIHPVHERVISVREAARFQTFLDDYYFFGNKTQLLKQVGNAVPTVLAYQIGKSIREKTGCSRSIDLFCGAGGMTVGLKAAGINSLLSNDIEESACVTLKINNPEIPVLCGDVTTDEVKDAIEKAAKEGGADIICGGPPCQGFSLAGFRADDDPRNQLFRDFADIVKRVDPKVIVFENVEGLLSYHGGQTYREVHTLFGELGYNTEGRSLMANDYAVPQKRKRVIIICTRKDLDIMPADLYPKEITVGEQMQVTARETIGDLEAVECSDSAKYVAYEESDILRFFKGEKTYDEYVKGRTPNSNAVTEKETTIVDKNGQMTLVI